MDFEAQLIAEHSKRNVVFIASYIGSNRKLFKEFLKVFETADYHISQRAAWVLPFVVDKHPEVIKGSVPYLIQLLNKPFHAAIRRNVLRVLEDTDIPEEEMGFLADKCFAYLHDLDEPIAVKAFAITVLYKICLKEPDLKNELIPTLQDMLPFGSAGIKVRCKKYLKLLEKLPKIHK